MKNCLTLTVKNAIGYYYNKHYWRIEENRIFCLDHQLLGELHKSYCSKYVNGKEKVQKCFVTTPNGTHLTHVEPGRLHAEKICRIDYVYLIVYGLEIDRKHYVKSYMTYIYLEELKFAIIDEVPLVEIRPYANWWLYAMQQGVLNFTLK